MFVAGRLGDQLPLRGLLTAGMAASGAAVCALGAAYFLRIHAFWYFAVVQVLGGAPAARALRDPRADGVRRVSAVSLRARRAFHMRSWESHKEAHVQCLFTVSEGVALRRCHAGGL